MEERQHEFTSKLFAYCLVIGIAVGLMVCLFLTASTPEGLTQEETTSYQRIATQFYETGNYSADDNIQVSSYSQHTVNVVNTDKPLTPSLTFKFEKGKVISVDSGINFSVVKVYPKVLTISILICLAFAAVVWVISKLLYRNTKEGR